jgi:two-component system, chemotaxis family, protein-glutamate methylesterase/glutaminase
MNAKATPVVGTSGMPGGRAISHYRLMVVEAGVAEGPQIKPQRRVIALRPLRGEAPDVVAIGFSTGGPQALFRGFGALKGASNQPIVIAQHMPTTFTTILAEHIARAHGYPGAEGVDGEPVQGGRIYVAPGDFQMTVEAKCREKVVRLAKTPPANCCRPSVDTMLPSRAAAHGSRLLTLILTGMGHDDLTGCRAVIEADGTLIAQEEATSIVWGMPGTVATAGLCGAVPPLNSFGPFIDKLVARTAR